MKQKFSTHLPTAILFGAVITAITILMVTRDAPQKEWAIVNQYVLLGLSVTLIFVYKIFWKKYPACDLFSGREDEPVLDPNGEIHYQRVHRPCGAPSVGNVRLAYTRATVYFCADHDPEISWMKEWLNRKQYNIDLTTLRRFALPPQD